MPTIKTGDLVRALKRRIFPKITPDMVTAAAEDGTLKAMRNPLKKRSNWFYDPESVKAYILGLEVPNISDIDKMEALKELGLSFHQTVRAG